MDKTMFYALGISLVVAALVVSGIGLRFESFPSSRGAMVGVLTLFAALVGATAVFAVRNSQDEQAKQEAEQATESTATETGTAAVTTTAPTSSTDTTTTASTATTAGPGGTVKITADPTGQLAFEQKSVSTKAGAVKIDFSNSSPVGHDVKVEDSSGSQLGGTNLVTGGSTTATVDLSPGTYTFYCDVPGHEQAGMKGTLTVK
jgi:plastocyanin